MRDYRSILGRSVSISDTIFIYNVLIKHVILFSCRIIGPLLVCRANPPAATCYPQVTVLAMKSDQAALLVRIMLVNLFNLRAISTVHN